MAAKKVTYNYLVTAMEANVSNLLPSRYAPARDHEISSPRSGYEKTNNHSKHLSGNDTVSISKQAQLSYSQSLARESSIEITTRDGDKVSINLSNSSSSQTSISYSDIQSQNSSKSALALSASVQSSSQYQISIEGNLDSDERKAIERLVNEISNVANKLYGGNTESAFKAASSIEYNSDELQDYSYDIKKTRTQQFITAYEEVANFQPNSQPKPNFSNNSFNLLDKLNELAIKTLEHLNDVIEPKQIDSLIEKAYDFLTKINEIEQFNSKNGLVENQ